ncbi:transferase family protein [Aspergillus karnatakaensis]|uniref:transferase family protein n=1 Tax=Aspergillus karnatakaensis TaxID=1810916 RepID=UPI003CCCF7C9
MAKVRVYPSRRPTTPVSTTLSILDATVARFTPTGAIWLFDSPREHINEAELLGNLQSSIEDTLNFFPQWAGQLHWAPVRPNGSHTERFNRPMLTYGKDTDPGVEWVVVRHESLSIESLAPSADERASGSGIWVGDDFDQKLFLSDTPLPLNQLEELDGYPAVQVQVSLFSDGGYGIGIKVAHPLADAQALMVFIHLWAENCRNAFGATIVNGNGNGDGDGASSFAESPVFDPSLLDAHAAGDIDGPTADPKLADEARQLPLHRFDWWKTDAPGYSPFLIPTTESSKPPPEDLRSSQISPSTEPPWLTWDFSRPVSYTQLHFPASRIAQLKQEAVAEGGCPGISRLDALLAHLWALINRARGHGTSPEDVYMNITLGARQRVSPPLPEAFIGSPLFLTHIRQPGSSACTSSIGRTALQIRQTMQQFTPGKIGAMLHDAAHEVSPQRLWQGFLGSQHTLVTSWLRLRIYDVDFVGGEKGKSGKARYVHAVMPKMDGCLQVMDTGVEDGGIDVALYLDSEVMGRLVGDVGETL